MHLLFFLCLFFPLFAKEIAIDGKIVNVEVADTHETRSKGLMGRRSLKEGHGMLFVYDKPQRLCFWMKDTLIPLSIAFFDKEKVLVEILDMDPPAINPPPQYKSRGAALYALEVPQGWFAKEKIKPGARLSLLEPQISTP